jgi:fatty acid desaturase
MSLVQAFPISRVALFRKLTRDITGLSALKRIYGLLLMDFGCIKYTVANETVWLDQIHMTLGKRMRLAVQNLHGVVITNLLLFLILKFLGLPHAYLLWVVSYLTTFSVIVRIRSIAEHAGTNMDLDPVKSTRTTHASFFARVTVAPHRVNYHLEHHLLMTAPYFQLPKLHALLRERGALDHALVSPGYVNVLKDVTTSS